MKSACVRWLMMSLICYSAQTLYTFLILFPVYILSKSSLNVESSAHNKSKDPYIELRSSFHESQHAARIWIDDLLNIQRKASPVHNIQNNHILHFGQSEHKKLLDLQTKFELGITVSFTDGHAKITIMGSPSGVTAAVLEVEAMCCMVQEAHALEEEASMLYSLVRWRCKDCPQLENPEINAALEKAYLTGSGNVTIDDDTRVNVTLKEVTTKYPEVKYTIDRMCKSCLGDATSERQLFFFLIELTRNPEACSPSKQTYTFPCKPTQVLALHYWSPTGRPHVALIALTMACIGLGSSPHYQKKKSVLAL